MDGVMRFPGAVRRDARIAAWFAATAPHRIMTETWFERMRGCGADVRELLHDGCPTACVGDTAFGYVNAFKAHASVGFFHGASLPDPVGLLEGTGKRMRHVKVHPGADVDEAALADSSPPRTRIFVGGSWSLIRNAAENCENRSRFK